MAEQRNSRTSPARHCDDIIELIDLALATCVTTSDRSRRDPALVTAPSR